MSTSNCCPSVPGRSTSLTPESPTTTIPKQRSRAGRNPKSLRTSKVTLTKTNREGGSELQLCTCLTCGNKFGIKAEQSDFYWTLNLLKGAACSRGNAISTEQPCLTLSLSATILKSSSPHGSSTSSPSCPQKGTGRGYRGFLQTYQFMKLLLIFDQNDFEKLSGKNISNFFALLHSEGSVPFCFVKSGSQ